VEKLTQTKELNQPTSIQQVMNDYLNSLGIDL
jgi:hypothetical protein